MKKTETSAKTSFVAFMVFSLIITLTLFIAWTVLISANTRAAEGGNEASSNTGASAEAEVTESAPVSIDISATIAGLEYSDLFEQAHLIVRGVVIDKNEEVLVQAVRSAEPMCFTDKYLEVHEVYRGTAESDTVTIRVAGGSKHTDAKVSSTTADYEPDLVPGTEYILFLYKPNYGGGWNTGEDYYKVVGYRQGAFTLQDKGLYFNEVFQMELDRELFKKEVAVINEKVPVDYDYQEKSILEALKSNEEQGVISQEQYKTELDAMQEYAKVIE